jgi:hypothetical protein
MMLLLPLYLPFMIVYTAILGLVVLPLTGFFCCCCGCGRLVENEPLAQSASQRQRSAAAAAAAAAAAGADGDTRRPVLSPMQGIRLSTGFIFLPFLLFLHAAFGWEFGFVDALFEDNHSRDASEIPTMELLEVSASTTNTTAPSSSININATRTADDDVDDDDLEDNVSGVVELIVNDDSRDLK